MFTARYTISDAVVQKVSAIERLSMALDALPVPGEILRYLQRQCLIALTHYSNQIEGNLLSFEEVSDLLERHRTFGRPRDEREVKNYFSLLEHIPAHIETHGAQITPDLVRLFHRGVEEGIVEEGLLGSFRTTQNAVDTIGGKIVYLPPEPNDVGGLVSDLCDWIHRADVHPIIAAAILHDQFVTIHPFLDGNGRCARSLSLYFLAAHGFQWRQWVPVDQFYASDRARYYAALQQEYPHNYYDGRCDTDFTSWIEYYVEGIAVMLAETIERVRHLGSGQTPLNNRQERILKYLQTHSAITAREYAARFSLSMRMAARDLGFLVREGKLLRLGKGPSVRYVRVKPKMDLTP